MRSTGVKVSVMALQGRKSSPQKSRPLESGHRRHAVWIAIEYSYKLSQKSEFKFWCELGWFLQRQSHITYSVLQDSILPEQSLYSVPLLFISHANSSWVKPVPLCITLPVRDHMINVFASHDLTLGCYHQRLPWH